MYILHGKSIISVKIGQQKAGQCVLCSHRFKLIWDFVLQMKKWQMTFSVCIIFFSLCLTFLLHPFIISDPECPNLNCMYCMLCFKLITFCFRSSVMIICWKTSWHLRGEIGPLAWKMIFKRLLLLLTALLFIKASGELNFVSALVYVLRWQPEGSQIKCMPVSKFTISCTITIFFQFKWINHKIISWIIG